MKKSLWHTILLPTAICAVLLLGIFLGRLTAGGRFELQKPGDTGTTAEWASDGKININLADVTVLQLLPGIGQVLAQRIVDYREQNGPFQDILQLRNVEGIGEGKYAAIAEYITVD